MESADLSDEIDYFKETHLFPALIHQIPYSLLK